MKTDKSYDLFISRKIIPIGSLCYRSFSTVKVNLNSLLTALFRKRPIMEIFAKITVERIFIYIGVFVYAYMAHIFPPHHRNFFFRSYV